MKKYLFATLPVLSLMLISFNAFGQDIEGFDFEMTISKAQVIAKFGNPIHYRSHDSELGLDESYYYNACYLHFCANQLTNFSVTKRGIRVLTKVLSGGVQVGDNISRLSSLKLTKNGVNEQGETIYEYIYKFYDVDPLYICVKNNIITCFYYTLHM